MPFLKLLLSSIWKFCMLNLRKPGFRFVVPLILNVSEWSSIDQKCTLNTRIIGSQALGTDYGLTYQITVISPITMNIYVPKSLHGREFHAIKIMKYRRYQQCLNHTPSPSALTARGPGSPQPVHVAVSLWLRVAGLWTPLRLSTERVLRAGESPSPGSSSSHRLPGADTPCSPPLRWVTQCVFCTGSSCPPRGLRSSRPQL